MPSSRDQIICGDRCLHFVRDAKINSQEADRVTVRSTRKPPRCDDDLSKSALKLKKRCSSRDTISPDRVQKKLVANCYEVANCY